MTWPAVGEPLPRAHDAYSDAVKWDEWILHDRRHGPDWASVFGVVDADMIWSALTEAILVAPVISVRLVADGGVSCGVRAPLTLNGRTATVRSAWHYASESDAPRLVTAFPTT
jgi:hypothetical protein